MNIPVAKIISKIILAERTINIKLLGDSITHGVGGTGFEQNGEQIVQQFARNKNGYCWANLFKEYMQENFNCVVTNNACTGTNIEFVIDNFKQLVDKDDDIVICTIGTNNRHQYIADAPKKSKQEYMKNFYNNIIKLHNMFKDAGKEVIFIANIPATAEDEEGNENVWMHFHMSDVNNLYMKASVDCGFPFISMYSRFLEYCENKGVSINSLLADGLHPNDNGHKVIFKLLLKELCIGKMVSSEA